MPEKLFLGCVADDFTGGSDAASHLAAGGLNTILCNGSLRRALRPQRAARPSSSP